MTAVASEPRAAGHPGAIARPWPVIVLEALTAISAVGGGVGLVWDNAIRMPDAWLAGTPFTSWVLPGVFLLLVVAVPMGGAAVLELRRSPWAPAASVVAGAALIGWIAVELLIMQKYNVLQPVMTLIGLVVLLLAVWARRDGRLLPERR